MLGLKLHSATSLRTTPLVATQKIIDGVTELAVVALGAAGHLPVVGSVARRVMEQLPDFEAAAEQPTGEAPAPEKPQNKAMRKTVPAHPDQTTVHLGPHPVERHPVQGGIRVHPAPAPGPIGVMHPSAAARHH